MTNCSWRRPAAARPATVLPIAASSGDTMAGAKFTGPKRRLDALAAIAPGIEMIPRIASLALRLARVASGALEHLCRSNSHDWDLAASDLLVHEAGGMLTDLEGEPLAYNRPDPVHGALVAAGRARHAALLNLVHDHKVKFA